MGKRPPSAANHRQDDARVDWGSLTSSKIWKRVSKPLASFLEATSSGAVGADSPEMEGQERSDRRVPLSEVVADCERRWFQDALKEAKAGDVTMQVIVGQMYYRGYGVPPTAKKGKAWITKASKSRPSALRVSNKHPGYNASDSDTDEVKDDSVDDQR